MQLKLNLCSEQKNILKNKEASNFTSFYQNKQLLQLQPIPSIFNKNIDELGFACDSISSNSLQEQYNQKYQKNLKKNILQEPQSTLFQVPVSPMIFEFPSQISDDSPQYTNLSKSIRKFKQEMSGMLQYLQRSKNQFEDQKIKYGLLIMQFIHQWAYKHFVDKKQIQHHLVSKSSQFLSNETGFTKIFDHHNQTRQCRQNMELIKQIKQLKKQKIKLSAKIQELQRQNQLIPKLKDTCKQIERINIILIQMVQLNEYLNIELKKQITQKYETIQQKNGTLHQLLHRVNLLHQQNQQLILTIKSSKTKINLHFSKKQLISHQKLQQQQKSFNNPQSNIGKEKNTRKNINAQTIKMKDIKVRHLKSLILEQKQKRLNSNRKMNFNHRYKQQQSQKQKTLFEAKLFQLKKNIQKQINDIL